MKTGRVRLGQRSNKNTTEFSQWGHLPLQPMLHAYHYHFPNKKAQGFCHAVWGLRSRLAIRSTSHAWKLGCALAPAFFVADRWFAAGVVFSARTGQFCSSGIVAPCSLGAVHGPFDLGL